jgi:hypothetical protein
VTRSGSTRRGPHDNSSTCVTYQSSGALIQYTHHSGVSVNRTAFRLAAVVTTLACSLATTQASAQTAKPLFAIGIQGGFTGAVMRATVFDNGAVSIDRSGAGRAPSTEHVTVPLSAGAVRAAVQLASRRHIFAIPRAAQNAVFGADIPVLSLTVYTSRGVHRVRAMGSETNHAPGTQRFFPMWTLFDALAGYPRQIG